MKGLWFALVMVLLTGSLGHWIIQAHPIAWLFALALVFGAWVFGQEVSK